MFGVNRRCDSASPIASVPLFLHDSLSVAATTDWLADKDNAGALAALECSQREPLYVHHSDLVAIVRPARATLDTLSSLVDVARRLEASAPAGTPGLMVDGLLLDPERLPPDLRHLVPLIVAWAVGDDLKRQELLGAANPKELEHLVKTVRPLLGRIDEYLDSFAPDAVPEEAALMGRLAEAVAELGEG